MTIQNIQSSYGNATVEYSRKAVSTEESYRQILEQKISQQDEVIRNGSTEKAIPLGGGEFTTEEWDGLLANFDATMDDLREQMRAEHQKRYEEQLEKIADARAEIAGINQMSVVTERELYETEIEYEAFRTSKYEVVPCDEYSCFDIYNEAGEHVGAFFYSDIKIRTDASTGTQLLISEHGTAYYTAMILDDELISGFEQCMGVEKLAEETLTGFTLNTHAGTGIRYLIKDGDEGRGGNILINSDKDRAAIDELAETYLRDYPNLVSNKEVAQINAVLEVLGLVERTPNGILSINRDGMSYNDNSDPEKNWALMFEGDYYNTVFEFVKMHRILGTDLSDYQLWDEFFEENGVSIERIWSDQELEQGYLNN